MQDRGKLRRCEQVAAVCFRVRSTGIEFLLVRTRKERWIFPKGSAEPGLTHAQAAALEAFEEAGVHGRMEEVSFTRYIQRKRANMRRSTATELSVSAHLCEVLRLGPPQEFNREPTWFSAEKAKRRLREDRPPEHGAKLARVVDRAVNRIQRLRTMANLTPDVRRPERQKKRCFAKGAVHRNRECPSDQHQSQISRGLTLNRPHRIQSLLPFLILLPAVPPQVPTYRF